MKTKILVALLFAVPVIAQTSVPEAMTKHWKVSGEFTIAVAKAMPAENYTFRPNPAEMSFGEVMAHIASVNNSTCANASGLTRLPLPPKIAEWSKDSEKVEVEKDVVIPFMADTFEFCNKAVAAMTPERWDKVQGPPARNMTGFEWLWAYFTHTAHHRGQAEVYMRVKGIKPPDYQF